MLPEKEEKEEEKPDFNKTEKTDFNKTGFNPFGVSRLGDMTLIPYDENKMMLQKTYALLDPETKIEAE